MKNFALAFGLGVVMSGTSLAAGHASFGVSGHSGGFYGHGYYGHGYYGGHGCWGWPFAPGFALGLGFGSLCASYPWGYYPYYGYSYYPAHAYAYAQPATTPVNAGTNSGGPAHASQAPEAPESTAWVPSTPGTGSWVPDPQPYCYRPEGALPSKAGPAPKLTETVSVTTTAGGVPVFSNE